MSAFERIEAPFPSSGGTCAAWLYTPDGAADGLPCVVMANGFSLTRHDGMPIFAETFAAAGMAVLAFDHRHLGDSPSETPGRVRVREQQADWRAAVARARAHPRVDPSRIVLWGFSMSGGHVATIAAKDPALAGVLLLCPLLDGLARVLNTPPKLAAWMLPRAYGELLGAKIRIPVTAQPGDHGAMTLPGEADGFARAVQPGSPWRNSVGPAVFTVVGNFRPVTRAKRVTAPVWLGLGGRDVSVSAKAVRRFADRAPRGELHEYPGFDHFDVLIGEAAQGIAADQLAFLQSAGVAQAS